MRAPAIGLSSGVRSIPTSAPSGPTMLRRVLQPRSRPAAEVEHAAAPTEQLVLLIDLFELEDRARDEALLLGAAVEDVVSVGAIAELGQRDASYFLAGFAAAGLAEPAPAFEAFIGFFDLTSGSPWPLSLTLTPVFFLALRMTT